MTAINKRTKEAALLACLVVGVSLIAYGFDMPKNDANRYIIGFAGGAFLGGAYLFGLLRYA